MIEFNNDSIGQKVAEHRRAQGLSQEKLAQMAEVPYATLTKIESGAIKNPSMKAIAKLAAALDSSLDDFLLAETYRGTRSIHRIWEDILETLAPGESMLITGVDESRYLKEDQTGIRKFIDDLGKKGLKQKLLSCEGDDFGFSKDFIDYRWIPKEYFNPNPIYTYADRVAFVMWGPPQQAVILKNATLADSYRKQFEFIWDRAIPKILK